MKIVLLCNDYQYRSFFQFHQKHLINAGHEVIYLSLGNGTVKQRRGFSPMINGLRRILAERRAGNADLVITFGPQAGMIAAMYRCLTLWRAKTLVWITGFSWEGSKGLRRIIRQSVDYINTKSANKVLTDSVWQSEQLRTDFRVNAEVLFNGSICGARIPDSKNSHALVEYSGEKRFAVVGRICEAKGILWLARALKKHKIFVDFFGPMEFETETAQNEFTAIIKSAAHLDYKGFKPFSEIVGGNYVLLAPSFREGLPMSLIDAQSHGMVVVARDIPGHREAAAHLNQDNLFSNESEMLDIIENIDLRPDWPSDIAFEIRKKYAHSNVLNDLLRVIR